MKDAFHRVNTNPEEHCTNLEYTVRDLVRKRKLGGLGNDEFLQIVDYSYNAQRWLTQINDVVLTPILGESTSTDPKDLFYLRLNYNTADNDLNAPARRNGNISNMRWQVIGEPINIYGFQYDFLDRLQQATYDTQNGGKKIVSEAYNSSYDYDLRGNVLSLTRNGSINNVVQSIDDLIYGYFPNSNRVQQITDNSTAGADLAKDCCVETISINEIITESKTFQASNNLTAESMIINAVSVIFLAEQSIILKAGFSYKPDNGQDFIARIGTCNDKLRFGFEDQTDLTDYAYDKNGNLQTDPDKGTTIQYNHLNLPYSANFDQNKRIEWLYDALGTKLRKEVRQGQNIILTQDYLEELEYNNSNLEAIYHLEGRVIPLLDNSVEYQYRLADHLANTRIIFRNNGSGAAEIVTKAAYYPFGLKIVDFQEEDSPIYRYLYNGIEHNTEFGLNVDMAILRTYDPATIRWWQIDPKVNIEHSPYSGFGNNPIVLVDPIGDTTRVYSLEGELLRTLNDNKPNREVFLSKDKFDLWNPILDKAYGV